MTADPPTTSEEGGFAAGAEAAEPGVDVVSGLPRLENSASVIRSGLTGLMSRRRTTSQWRRRWPSPESRMVACVVAASSTGQIQHLPDVGEVGGAGVGVFVLAVA